MKHYTWVDAGSIDAILHHIASQLSLQTIHHARQHPCEALNPSFPAVHVSPETWGASCYRQASWFRASCLKDKHLIVTSNRVSIENTIMTGTITKISGITVPGTTREQYQRLLDEPEFKRAAPAEWFHLLEREIPLFKNFLERKGVSIELDAFLEMHSANHAQFLVPREKVLLTMEHQGEQIPCSLFPSTFICSACMELFGVIGSHLKRKALMNCPGLKYTTLEPGEFFLVEIEKEPRGSEREAKRVQDDDQGAECH